MSLTILSRKLDKLNEQEKRLKLTYDVRGNNKHQHRYIKDLKDDFKEDLQLRFGSKPIGLGWNQESENGSEKPEDDGIDAEEIIDDDEQELHEENADMISPATAFSNFRPGSGKVVSFTPQNRPFSASTGRPGTAGSVNAKNFMFSTRPISAIPKMGKNFQGNVNEVSESTLLMSMKGPQSMYQLQPHEVQEEAMQGQSSEVERNRVSESIFWKNTKKYDNAQSAKQFQTKNLLFNTTHSNPKLINQEDLDYLKEEKVLSIFEKSKLKAPADHDFREVALKKKVARGTRGNEGEASYFAGEGETQLDAKNSFNQSLSYIHTLRTDFKSSTPVLREYNSANSNNNKRTKQQRPVTAHPMISAKSPVNNNQKVQLEIVKEQVQENHKVYFSSLSDLRKKAFFLRLHSMEPAKLNQPGLNKELKMLDWTMFKEISIQPDFQSINLMLVDLNTFDHARYELEFQENGGLKAKDKEDLRDIVDVQKEFRESNRTNIAALIIYVETTTNRLLDVFSRVLVQEKQDNEYDLMVWRNIYRYLLYKIILANSPLYPEQKSYNDFSKMIKEIIDDKKDYVSPVSSQIQLTKDQPIVVERNAHVYNFDFHSYILECSSHYAQSIGKAPQKFTGDISNRKKEAKLSDNAKQRPASAMEQKNRFPMFGQNKQTSNNAQQTASRKESLNVMDHALQHNAMMSPAALSTARQEASGLDRPSVLAGYSYEQVSKMERPSSVQGGSGRKIMTSRSMRSLKKGHENVDMTLQGGRMDIYQDIKAASMARSTTNLRDQSDIMSMTYGGDMQRYFSSSVYQTPKEPERLFQVNPNGITVTYNKSPMKKKNNVIIRSRPQSSKKAEIKPHNLSIGHSVGMSVGNVRAETSFRFKF